MEIDRAQPFLEPPRGFFSSLKYLGPGLILSAAIVGSGELIATTALGAKAGFAVLWVSEELCKNKSLVLRSDLRQIRS